MSRKDEVGRLTRLRSKQEFKRAFTPLEMCSVWSGFDLFPSMMSVLVYGLPNGDLVAMVRGDGCVFAYLIVPADANTIVGLPSATHNNVTMVALGLIASVDWGCAVQITVAASIGSRQTCIATNAQTCGIYTAILLSHGLRGYKISTLPSIYGAHSFMGHLSVKVVVKVHLSLCLAVIIGLPAVTPKQDMNNANFTLTTVRYPETRRLIKHHVQLGLTRVFILVKKLPMQQSLFLGPLLVQTSSLVCSDWPFTFCMDVNIENILSSPIGRPMAEILFSRFGQRGTLALWSFVVIAQFLQHPGKPLRFPGTATRTPINTVWFVVIADAPLGLLAFAGTQAINAMFSVTVNALYIAYSIPIAAHWLGCFWLVFWG
ncbi:hypothetical protein V8B97DRAFT_1913561 [Scleroderma yunnanense]